MYIAYEGYNSEEFVLVKEQTDFKIESHKFHFGMRMRYGQSFQIYIQTGTHCRVDKGSKAKFT